MSLAPLLTSNDEIPEHDRVAIAGVTGVGKTTLARTLSAGWDLPYTELDSLFHGENWVPRPSFEADAQALIAEPRWVSEVSYFGHGVGQQILQRTQLLLWLDYPRRIALPRLVRRTVRRRVTREELWNGNHEGPLWSFFTDPSHIIRWEMQTYKTWKSRIPRIREEYEHLTIVRFAHPRETAAWVARNLTPAAR